MKFYFTAISIFLFTSLQAAVYLKVVYVADHSVVCDDKKCLLIRDAPTDTFSVFKHTIEGFVYEEGFEYCILMEIQTPGVSMPPVPFDSSQIRYVLSEIKSKQQTKQEIISTSTLTAIGIPDSSKWTLYKLRMQDGTKTFSIQKAYLQFDTRNNIVHGNTDCNDFNASFSAGNNSIKIENIISTKMACNKRAIEPAFINMLQLATHYKVTPKLLYIYKEKKLLGLFTRKK